jgi:type IV pilus assembly protein PilM
MLKKGEAVDGAAYEDVLPVLHAMTENVLREILKTFDFFKATASSDRIDRVILSGGSSRVDGFARALEERFDAPVETFDPFKRIGFEPVKFGVADPLTAGPTAAVAVGLALRKVGDR